MFMEYAGIEQEKDILDKYNLANIEVLKVDIMWVRQVVVKSL